MQIVCYLHEMSNPIVWGNNKKKKRINNLSSAKLTQRVLRFKNDITLYKNLCLNIHCESHIIYTLV